MARRVLIRDFDSAAKTLQWTGTVQPAEGSLPGYGLVGNSTVENFATYRRPVMVLPTYQEGDSASTTVIDAEAEKFVPRGPSGCEEGFSHERVPGRNVCLACEEIELKSHLVYGLGRKYHLGWFKDVANCQNCDLCRLLTRGLEANTEPSVFREAAEKAEFFIFITTVAAAFPLAPSRRARPYELCVWVIHVGGRRVAETRVRLVADCAARLGKAPRFHGRYVDPQSANLELARSWIDECSATHSCGQSDAKERRDVDEKLTLIDTKEACLVDMTWAIRYVALSYVWPRFETTCLIESNSHDLHQPGSLRATSISLPRVIIDAMDVVQRIGERYLWVDALCIVQDSPADKDRLINAMDRVYGRSFLTIVVASGREPSMDYGIPGVNGTSRLSTQHSAQMDDADLVTALPNYEEALKRSIWSTRGWTFQEGILSERCLAFTDQQMFFRCGHDSRCEDVQAEGAAKYEKHSARPNIRQGQLDYLVNDGFLRNVSENNTFYEYALLVSGYSSRNLTFEKDVLLAFAGIMQGLIPHFGPDGFFCGIPMQNFDRAILWYPTSRLRRRQIQVDGNPNTVLPSWSWASWVGKVAYDMDAVRLDDKEAVLPMVEWWRLHGEKLVPVRNYQRDSITAFSEGLLEAEARNKGLDPRGLIFWGTCVELTVDPQETDILEWVIDHEQAVPCFTIMDEAGDACGMLPSADSEWADKYKSQGAKRLCQFLLLSYASQSPADAIIERAQFFHHKYGIQDTPFRCFYNVMLVEFDELGIAYRKGIGRIHKDAIDDDVCRSERKIMILG